MSQTTVAAPEKKSSGVTQTLKCTLSDTYVLYIKTQNFHWNVEDPRFQQLHKLFEHQYEDLAEALDELAERLRALNVKAPGSMKEFLKESRLKESEGALSGQQMLQELAKDNETLSKSLNEGIAKATEVDDFGTADLFTQRLRVHQKAAWMLRSHLNHEI